MPVETQQVIIEFVTEDSQLDSTEKRLQDLGKTDAASAKMFQETNKQLAEREKISQKIVVSQTKEQATVNKLVSSLKTLSGESKKAVESLLKLSTDEIAAGFDAAGLSVDEYVAKLQRVGNQGAKGLKPLGDQLKVQDALTGKFTLSITKEQQQVNKLVTSMKGLTDQGRAAVQSLLKLPTDEIIEGFSSAGLSIDQYLESLRKQGDETVNNEQKTKGLRQQLRAMIEELTRMKVAGLENTEAYKKLAAEAGELSDTIGDVRAQVQGLGNDTAAIEGVIQSVQGLAGTFAIAQGAQALFGKESQEIQEVLLRVNAAMAILQGLQQVQVILQKESAASLLFLNIQRKAQNAQLVLENALQSKSVIVRGAATVAQKALNAAMAANPIGLIIVALTTVIGLFALYANNAKKAAQQQAALNAAIREATEGLEGEIEGLRRASALRESELVNSGARQSAILRQQAQTEVQIEEARLKEIKRLNDVIKKNTGIDTEESLKSLQEAETRRTELLNQSADARLGIEIKNKEGRKQVLLEGLEDAVAIRQAEVDRIAAIGSVNTSKDFQTRRDLLRAQAALETAQAGANSAKLLAIRKKLANDLHQIDIAQREQAQKESLAALDAQLTAAQKESRAINERTSQEEIDIQKKIILTTARFEAQQEGLSQIQRVAIRAKALQEITNLQRDFNKQTITETLQDQISLNEAELARVEIGEEQKLDLKIENIIAAAAIELEQNKGVSAKIKEINARRDADIKAARLQSIEETLDYELRINELNFAARNREIERELSGQDSLRGLATARQKKQLADMLGIRVLNSKQEIELINEQLKAELTAIDTRREALKKEAADRLISPREYNLKLKELEDQEAQVVENAEQKKRNSRIKSFEEQKRLDQQRVEIALQVAGELSNVLAGIADVQAAKESNYIASQRAKIKELREAGAITEKEEINRIKKIDAEERKIRYAQAVREKQQALFNAILNTAAAIAKANPIVPLMVLAGAAGAAQIAIIASKPIPKFAKGKDENNHYEGPGIVGEAGAELVEQDGRMFIAKKPTMLWLGKKDIVYTNKETKEIINRSVPAVNNKIVLQNNQGQKAPEIDYEKLGASIGKHTSTTLSIDGYKDFIKKKQSFETYLNSRRGY